MNHKNALISACLAVSALGLSASGLAQDMTAAPAMQQPKMPMMGIPQGTMPMMQGQQGSMPMMQGQQGGMPMMPGYGRHHGMHMQGQPGAGMPGCQHGGKHHMGGDGKGMRHQRHEMMQAHHKNMEERLARIEALLQQLVDQQKK